MLSPIKRIDEEPLSSLQQDSQEAYEKALFYMYGGLESLQDGAHIVHNLLRRYNIWNGTAPDVEKYLNKQIVI